MTYIGLTELDELFQRYINIYIVYVYIWKMKTIYTIELRTTHLSSDSISPLEIVALDKIIHYKTRNKWKHIFCNFYLYIYPIQDAYPVIQSILDRKNIVVVNELEFAIVTTGYWFFVPGCFWTILYIHIFIYIIP